MFKRTKAGRTTRKKEEEDTGRRTTLTGRKHVRSDLMKEDRSIAAGRVGIGG
jgi:hypothetical protein